MARKRSNKSEKAGKNATTQRPTGKPTKDVEQEKPGVGTAAKNTNPKASSALLDAAANVSFPVAAGHPIRLGSGYGEALSVADHVATFRIPGVMRLGYLPTFGELKDWTSPANVWVRDWFTFIRHHNSGHSNYDAPALAFYGLSIRSCFDFMWWMQRIYGVAKGSYVPMNAYTPADVVNACGGVYEDIIMHMADLRFYISSFAARLNIMKVPNFKFFTAGKELLNNVYADTDHAKASFYIFDPDGFWRFHTGETAEDTYMEVVPKLGPMTYAEIVELGESLLNTVLNSEDFNIMSGDIKKAYDDYCAPSIIDEDFTVVPLYDPSMLWMIHNATYLHGNLADAEEAIMNWRIYQNLTEGDPACNAMQMKSSVFYPHSASGNYTAGHVASLCMDRLIDLNTDPSPSNVAAATRFMVICEAEMFISDDGEEEGPLIKIDSCQSEVITSLTIIDQPRGNLKGVDYTSYPTVSRFDLHPYLTSCKAYYNTTTNMLALVQAEDGMYAGEVTNPSVLHRDTKKNIDLAVMLDLFGG